MTVYVDDLAEWGWKIRGVEYPSCHLFTDSVDLTELHALAAKIGMKRSWFQDKASAPHYDLVPNRRAMAVKLGAVELDRRSASEVWKARRVMIAALKDGAELPIVQSPVGVTRSLF